MTRILKLPSLPILNADDVSIKGAKYIYAPRGQAREYAPLAANPYRGCGHKCAYCYVPNVLRMDRKEFDAGASPRRDYLKGLLSDVRKYQAAGITEQVLLSFSTDPYPPGCDVLTRETLIVLRDHGLGFCTLTKGEPERCPTSTCSAPIVTPSLRPYSRSMPRSRGNGNAMRRSRPIGSPLCAPSTIAAASPGYRWSARSTSSRR